MPSKTDQLMDAVEAFEQSTGAATGIDFQQVWRQELDGSWSPEPRGYWAGVNAMRGWLAGKGHAASAVQLRQPDLTVNGTSVFDLHFTQPDGTIDGWSAQPGAGNGQTGLEDCVEINRQNSPELGDDNPKLDAEGNAYTAPAPPGEPARGAAPGAYGPPTSPPRPTSGEGATELPVATPIFGPGPSSRRYKEDVAPADLRPERLLALGVKSFRWRQDGRADIGLIAEEVRQALPELYFEDAAFAGVQAGHLPFYLLELVKQQQAQITELTARIDALHPGSQEGEA